MALEVRILELRFRALRCFEDKSIDLFFRFEEVKTLGFRFVASVDEVKLKPYFNSLAKIHSFINH